MPEPLVLTEVVDHVGWITFNDPERMNPVTPRRAPELIQTCRDLSENDDVRVVVVTGAGRAFNSGADLKLSAAPDHKPGPGSDTVVEAGPGMWLLPAMRQPVIAMVNGAAVGWGAELAVSADIRIAGESARFRFPFSLLGVVSDTGAATWLMPRLIGWSRTAEILYTGRMVSAAEALEIGLVNRVVPDAELRTEVTTLAAAIAERSTSAVREMKRMIFAGLDERKAEHALRQYFSFAQRDPDVDVTSYFPKAVT